MTRALALAERGLFTTTPNPRVGCVIARDGLVLGEGWHERAGEAHAEIRALDDARTRGNDVRGATVYVTLGAVQPPGRTPPCSEALLAAGIGRVVAAMSDPDPNAAGGADRLKAAGRDGRAGAPRGSGAGAQRRLDTQAARMAGPGYGSRSRQVSMAAPRSKAAPVNGSPARSAR